MPSRRLHPKIWLAWGRWWAFQIQMPVTLALGVRVELARPMLDVYVGPGTLALGRHPLLTSEFVRHADSCRGFVFSEEEIL